MNTEKPYFVKRRYYPHWVGCPDGSTISQPFLDGSEGQAEKLATVLNDAFTVGFHQGTMVAVMNAERCMDTSRPSIPSLLVEPLDASAYGLGLPGAEPRISGPYRPTEDYIDGYGDGYVDRDNGRPREY